VPSTCERRRIASARSILLDRIFQAFAARFGDVHCGDLVARFLAVEETLAAVRTSAHAIECSEGALRGDTEAENLRGSAE
jgi:hypothetical protein